MGGKVNEEYASGWLRSKKREREKELAGKYYTV
jgi:hypothetical protein